MLTQSKAAAEHSVTLGFRFQSLPHVGGCSDTSALADGERKWLSFGWNLCPPDTKMMDNYNFTPDTHIRTRTHKHIHTQSKFS